VLARRGAQASPFDRYLATGDQLGSFGGGEVLPAEQGDLGDLYVSFSKGPGTPGPSLFSSDGGDQ
jgi:hypothetical protein